LYIEILAKMYKKILTLLPRNYTRWENDKRKAFKILATNTSNESNERIRNGKIISLHRENN